MSLKLCWLQFKVSPTTVPANDPTVFYYRELQVWQVSLKWWGSRVLRTQRDIATPLTLSNCELGNDNMIIKSTIQRFRHSNKEYIANNMIIKSSSICTKCDTLSKHSSLCTSHSWSNNILSLLKQVFLCPLTNKSSYSYWSQHSLTCPLQRDI